MKKIMLVLIALLVLFSVASTNPPIYGCDVIELQPGLFITLCTEPPVDCSTGTCVIVYEPRNNTPIIRKIEGHFTVSTYR
jgi:hypothetical protein